MTTTIEIDVEMILKFFLLFVKKDVFDKIDEQKRIKKVHGVKVNMDSPDKKIIFLGVSRRYWSLIYFIDAIVTKLLYKKINEKRNMRSFSQHDSILFVLGSFIESKYPGLIDKFRKNMKNNFQQEVVKIGLTGMNSFFKSSDDLINYINSEFNRNTRLDSGKKNILFETIKKTIFMFSDINSFLEKGFESLFWKMVNDDECLFDEITIKLFENNIKSVNINEYFDVRPIQKEPVIADNSSKKRNLPDVQADMEVSSNQSAGLPSKFKKRIIKHSGYEIELSIISEDEMSETESDIEDFNTFKTDINALKMLANSCEKVSKQYHKPQIQKETHKSLFRPIKENIQHLKFKFQNSIETKQQEYNFQKNICPTINLNPNASLLNKEQGFTQIGQNVPIVKKNHVFQPLKTELLNPMCFNGFFTIQPENFHTSQPENFHTSQPENFHTSQLENFHTQQPEYFHTQQPEYFPIQQPEYFHTQQPKLYYERICLDMNNDLFKKKFMVDPNEPYPFC